MGQDRTDAQFIAQAAAMSVSSVLSIIGSSLILIMVRRDTSLVYHRILIMLSIGDIVFGLFNAMHLFAVPADRTISPIAIGNDTTCTAFGFVLNVGPIYTSVYNAFLATNFYLQIRYKWTNRQIAEKIEPFVHAFAIGMSTVIPTVALVQDKYALNYMTGLCLMGTYSEVCEEVIVPVDDLDVAINGTSAVTTVLECTPAAVDFSDLAYGAAGILTVLGNIGIYSTVGLYRTVYSTYSANERYVVSSSPSTVGNDTPSRPRSSRRKSELSPQQEERLKQVTWQCVMYGIVYANTFMWLFALGVVELATDMLDRLGHPGIFALLLLLAWFSPLQGFFNFGVFIWPKYQKTKKMAEHRLQQIISERWSTRFGVHSEDTDLNGTTTINADSMHARSNRSFAAPARSQSHVPGEGGLGNREIDAPMLNPFRILYWTINEVDSSRISFSQKSFPSLNPESENSQRPGMSTEILRNARNCKLSIADRTADGNGTSDQDSEDDGETRSMRVGGHPAAAAEGESGSGSGSNGGTTGLGPELNEGMQTSQTRKQLPSRTSTPSESKHMIIDHTGAVKQ